MKFRSLAGAFASLIMTACSSSGSGTPGAFSNTESHRAIIDNYVDNVIVATYLLLRDRTHLLREAVTSLEEDPTSDHLFAAQEAWISARIPWEQSEAFLFGPVDTNGFDPALDSWPVNRTDLDNVLASGDPLTQSYISSLDPTLKGFHTLEYLLFGPERNRTLGQLNARMMEYMEAVASELEDTAAALHGEWVSNDDPFGEAFKAAGAGNAAYPSLASAAEEMVRGIITITDEVANGKIADPFEQQNTQLVESQFSFNSLDDFADNLRGVRFVYHGDQETAGSSGEGLDEFVQSIDPALDSRIDEAIDDAIRTIEGIPYPFRDSLLDPDHEAVIRAAQDAIRVVQSLFENDVLPLITG